MAGAKAPARPGFNAVGLPVAVMLIMAPLGGQAQGLTAPVAAPRALTIEPRLLVRETLTDNVHLSSGAAQSDQVTEISPGIRLYLDGARLKGYFDYALTGVVYAQNSAPRESKNALSTAITLEAIDNWAFIDFSGAIAQEAISAFGTPSIDNVSVNANRTEVSTYRVSPHVRGRWRDLVDYEARYSRSVTGSEAATGTDGTTVDHHVKLSGDTAFRGLGWSASASRQRVDYSAGRQTEADRLDLGLSYEITPQLKVLVHGGREADNYTSLDKQSHASSGFGVTWTPSLVTQLSASRDQHSYGAAHSLSFEHRTPRTVWRFTDTRNVVTTPSQTGVFSLGSIYDLLYAQFVAFEPDPIARARLVEAYLRAYGVSPGEMVTSNFLTSAVSLQRRQNFSFALLGIRDTVTFVATRSEGRRLDLLSTAFDDLSSSSLLRQRGFSINYAHRLTPEYSFAVLLSQQNTLGDAPVRDTSLRALNVNVTGKVSPKATASVALRRVVFSGGSSPYTENALTVSLNVRF